MTKWAFIVNGKVDTISFEDQSDQEGWVPVADTIFAGFEKSGSVFMPPEAPAEQIPGPASVTSRQFKLQLLSLGILDQVDKWVSQQSREVQIAYEYSGLFVRSEPMMAMGFQALGFAEQQVDEFFRAASVR